MDIGAKYDIYKLIFDLADRRGHRHGVLRAARDLGMSDRVLVMNAGRVAAEFPIQGLTQERVLAAALNTEPLRHAA